MNQINGSGNGQPSNTLAAIFATTHDAREAIKELHKAGFKKTWLGVTKKIDRETGEAVVEEGGGLSRFLSPDRISLSKALLKQGVSDEQALQVEQDIAVGCAVVTVYAEDNPDKATDLLSEAKGQVVAGAVPTAVAMASSTPRVGVDKDQSKGSDDTGRGAPGLMRDDSSTPTTQAGQETDYAVEEFYLTGR